MTPEELLAEHDPSVVELALRVRELILMVMPEATEKVYAGWHGIGYHDPQAGYVCAIFPAADHIRVGFEHGNLLPDPDGRLEGEGSQVRYLTIRSIDAPLEKALAELIDHALT